jgi:hypothetical protein
MSESWRVEPLSGSGPQDQAAARAGRPLADAGDVDVDVRLPLSPLQSWLLYQSLDRPAEGQAP